LSPNVMYNFSFTGVRLENHFLSPVMCREHPESINQMFSKPPACSQKQERERASDSTLGLAQRKLNQCRAICSKEGLANITPLPPNFPCPMGGVRAPRGGKRGP
jgi:hypothetical protein